MPTSLEISTLLGEVQRDTPAGYAFALHINFTAPTFLFQTYAKHWLDHYSSNSLVMKDPIVAWGFENDGYCRWSSLAANDPANVLQQAADHGLGYGIVGAVETDGSRSICGFARADREFSDAEADSLMAAFHKLHSQTAHETNLPAELVTQLKKMSIMVTHPGA